MTTFQNVYSKHRLAILRYLTKLVGNFDCAEDLTQEVFIKVNNNLDKFRGDSSLATWIYKIATNIANDHFRSVSYRYNTKQTISNSSISEKKNYEIALLNRRKLTPEQQLIKDEMNICISKFISQLRENYRTVILLSDYEGLKNKEIADILDVSIDTVKIRLHRARTTLKTNLSNGCDIYTSDGEMGCNEK